MPLRIALIGQNQFGAEVFKLLLKEGHDVVGVFTVPDQGGKSDVLASTAEKAGVKVFKFKNWRIRGTLITEVFADYKSIDAELNVLAFCSQYIPMDVINFPKYQSICYHPSILPRHRGASAINWTLMQGDKKAGFTVFWPDDGLDTGEILLQEEIRVDPNDTLDSLYNRFLFPAGVKGMVKAVRLIAEGQAPKIKQPEEGASYDPMIKKDTVEIQWNQPAEVIHNFIRGNDKVPGAWTVIDGQKVALFGSQVWEKTFFPRGRNVVLDRAPSNNSPAIVHRGGMLFFGNDGKAVNIRQIVFEDGRMINACDFGKTDLEEKRLELTETELAAERKIKDIWAGILGVGKIECDSDFFKLGARSMDVIRLVEEINFKVNGCRIFPDDIYMAPLFDRLVQRIIRKQRGLETEKEFAYDAVILQANNLELKIPHQLFINNEFVDSLSGQTFPTINPTDESVICHISKGNKDDVELAVDAAEAALRGQWGQMNARDRGALMYRLADLMDASREELATLESLDSGAVYTLALKTHVGMSIDTFRYFAGWCDKIQGKTIPINNARPNANLTFTKREPVGVCGIIIPWNYPLMMLSWKVSACLAAGNVIVLKPANVTSLTALKFCELVVKAGFPPGVVNVVPGSGAVVGQALADHPRVRKIGFTGSTDIGKTIMESCAKTNLKKVSLELGGKSPLIIFNDCELEKAVRMAMSAVFFNKGENCIAAGRLFVESSIHDQFVEQVVFEVKKMKIGDPLDRSTDHGPQNHRAHLEKLVEYCQRGVAEGAKLVYGGTRVNRPGLFFTPTVFTDVEDDNYIAMEESFGPIMIISKFQDGDIEGVIRRANGTEFGLASGVFTRDINKALSVADRIEAGTVFINTYNKTDVAAPFGGFKQSGFGKDLGEEALNEYLRTKCVTVEY